MSEEIMEQKAPQERLLTVAEFAKEIGKTERQVYRYIKNQRVHSLSPEETGMAGVRIASSELEKFLNDQNSASGGWRVRSASAGVGSSFESFEDSVEGLATDSDTGIDDGESYASPVIPDVNLTVPLERHEAAVMRLGYLQSQYELSQRLLSEGSSKESELKQQVAELQAALVAAQEKVHCVEDLERKLAEAKEKTQELQKEGTTQKGQLLEAQEEALRFKIKAEVEADSRAQVESRLRTISVRLEDAEKRAAAPWWKKLFG